MGNIADKIDKERRLFLQKNLDSYGDDDEEIYCLSFKIILLRAAYIDSTFVTLEDVKRYRETFIETEAKIGKSKTNKVFTRKKLPSLGPAYDLIDGSMRQDSWTHFRLLESSDSIRECAREVEGVAALHLTQFDGRYASSIVDDDFGEVAHGPFCVTPSLALVGALARLFLGRYERRREALQNKSDRLNSEIYSRVEAAIDSYLFENGTGSVLNVEKAVLREHTLKKAACDVKFFEFTYQNKAERDLRAEVKQSKKSGMTEDVDDHIPV